MHPTLFELRSFGLPRLPPAKGHAILRHLRTGCERCGAALAPRLLPWMDAAPAAEARATDPARCGRTLQATYLRAAARALTAAGEPRAPTGGAGNRHARQALAILDAEGPEAIGRLPRRLLGLPAVEALLRQTVTLGPRDPRLRLRLSELACDLADSARGERHQLQHARCRATIELANARRVALELRPAQQLLDRAAEELARHGCEPLLHARFLEIQANVLYDAAQTTAGRQVMAAAMALFRQGAQRAGLARTLVREASVSTHCFGDPARGQELFYQALGLVEPGEEPLITSTALGGVAHTMLRLGRWREALECLRRHDCSAAMHGMNRARLASLEGEILSHAGDWTGAARAFDFGRREQANLGHPFGAGLTTLTWARMLQQRGEVDAAAKLIDQATESMLGLDPHRELYLALMYLRTANRFSHIRSALPLGRMLWFLSHSEWNPSLRLRSYLP
jgi:tetratricopeptide (TPR) repeat protein